MAEPSEPAPFSTHAARYMAAGWRGVLPIPPRKKTSPPTGYTGNSGAYPTEVNIGAWAADEPAANIPSSPKSVIFW